MMKKSVLIILSLLLLVTAACNRRDQATPTPAVESDAAAPEATVVEANTQTSSETTSDPEVVSRIGIDPNQISLNTQGLPYPWQANAVAATTYDASQPPGPKGLPDHIQINFGTTDPTQRQAADPIMYIIPVDAFKNVWDAAQDDSVNKTINGVFQLTTEIPSPPPASGMPTLPFEEITGYNDLAVQGDQPIGTDISDTNSGYRFLGRFMQNPTPVSNEGMRYIYQGFTNDGKYLVTFFYSAATEFLPDTAADAAQEEVNLIANDAAGYLTEKANQLNALNSSAWEPDLATLDDLVSSLVIAGMPANGIEGQVWQLVARSDGTTEEALGNTEKYTVVFQADGQLSYTADCNSGSGAYHALGGMVGALAVELGPSTLAECGSGSLSSELVETLSAAQDYAIRPGGNVLELIKLGGSGSLLFRNSGPTDAASADAESAPVVMPAPEPQAAYAQVIAPSGVNIRSGPGTNYSVIGTAAVGAEGAIVGRSQDGLWWVVSVEGAPNGQGWVSASQVQAFNVESVPIVAAPALPTPVPTPTPVPKPTATPKSEKAKIRFTADRKKINAGECAVLVWQVKNIKAVWIYPKGKNYKDYPAAGEGAQEVCPSKTTTYRMKVLKTDGSVVQKKVKIKVNTPVAVQLPG